MTVGVCLHHGDDARAFIFVLRPFAQQIKIADKGGKVDYGKAAIRGKSEQIHSAPFCYDNTIFACFQVLCFIFLQFIA